MMTNSTGDNDEGNITLVVSCVSCFKTTDTLYVLHNVSISNGLTVFVVTSQVLISLTLDYYARQKNRDTIKTPERSLNLALSERTETWSRLALLAA